MAWSARNVMQYGLFQCCLEKRSCFMSSLLPCVSFGLTLEKANQAGCVAGVCAYSLCCCIAAGDNRGHVEEYVGVSDSGLCLNAAIHLFCGPCALAQESRAVDRRLHELSDAGHSYLQSVGVDEKAKKARAPLSIDMKVVLKIKAYHAKKDARTETNRVALAKKKALTLEKALKASEKAKAKKAKKEAEMKKKNEKLDAVKKKLEAEKKAAAKLTAKAKKPGSADGQKKKKSKSGTSVESTPPVAKKKATKKKKKQSEEESGAP